MAIIHYDSCNPNYPEKIEGELPQQIFKEDLGDGYFVHTCVDCGAFETNLPPDSDPYWDDVRKELNLQK